MWVYNAVMHSLLHLCDGERFQFGVPAERRNGVWQCPTCLEVLPEHLEFVMQVERSKVMQTVTQAYFPPVSLFYFGPSSFYMVI